MAPSYAARPKRVKAGAPTARVAHGEDARTGAARASLGVARDLAHVAVERQEALPGGGDLVNMPYAGWTTGGDYMMRIASDGRIGVLWKNMDIGGASGTGTADMGLYFVESTDGGKTWPATLQALVPIGNPQTIGSGTATLSPTSSFDFWYDGTLPKFFWMAYFADYSSNNDASWTYYPTTSTFFFWNPATMTSALDIATLGLTNPIDSLPMVFHSPTGVACANARPGSSRAVAIRAFIVSPLCDVCR